LPHTSGLSIQTLQAYATPPFCTVISLNILVFSQPFATKSQGYHNMHPPTEEEVEAIAKDLLCNHSGRLATFSRYFKFYTSITCPSSFATSIQIDNPAFSTHRDILDCVEKLRRNPKLTREQLVSTSLPNRYFSTRDKDDATRTIVRVAFMLDCSLKDKFSENFEVGGYIPAKWESNEPFETFVQRAVLKSSDEDKTFDFKVYKNGLKAWKLKKRHKLQIRPTDNLMEHLLYDPVTRVVKVFHHTSYLKAHLIRSANQPVDLDTHSSLTLYGGNLHPSFAVLLH
jgi:hypothetical protein